jgi:aryl sulfotransferase
MAVDVDALKPYRTAVQDNRRWADFEVRPDDIFVCTPAKSGTTWTQTMIANLLWPDGRFPAPVLTMSPWIEAQFLPCEAMHQMLRAQQHRRFMKSHTPADGIPYFPEAKYVFVARDGRDAFMSMCNHMERMNRDLVGSVNAKATADALPPMPPWTGDVHAFFREWLAMAGHIQHVATFWPWRQRPNVLLLHYNDLKTDLSGEMRRLARYLDIDLPEADWPAAVQRCTFESMRNQEQEISAFEAFEGGIKGFLFKGTNGRWRDVLTAAELEGYARRVSELLPADAGAWMEHGRARLGAVAHA